MEKPARSARRASLRKRGTALREGGCLFDADGDGQPDLVASEPGALVWFRFPDGARHVIDTGADSPDIIPAVLLGRRGVLLIHKHAQVRFYEPGRDPAAPWHATDLYSIYTPSWQGGLRLADIDRDGRTDILCGNYWIRSPERWELPVAPLRHQHLDRGGALGHAAAGLGGRQAGGGAARDVAGAAGLVHAGRPTPASSGRRNPWARTCGCPNRTAWKRRISTATAARTCWPPRGPAPAASSSSAAARPR